MLALPGRMQAWRTVQQQLRETFMVRHEDGSSTQLMVNPPGGERSWLTVQLHRESVRPWDRLLAPVCAEYLVDPRAALQANATLVVGSLAAQAGMCVLQQCLPLEGLDRQNLAVSIVSLVHEAGRLRRAMSRAGTELRARGA